MFIHRTGEISPVELNTSEGPNGRFYLTPEGLAYPSITTILGAGDKPWLTAWRESLGVERADAEMRRAAERGTAVHLMAERYLNNEPNPSRDQLPEHVREFNALRTRLNKIDQIYTQETPLWSDVLRCAGRVDCVGNYDGVLSIIDFKTSTNNKNQNMIGDYFLQTTAYALMFHERYGIKIDDVVILMSSERGAVPLMFKQKIDDYIVPLIERINTYHVNFGATI